MILPLFVVTEETELVLVVDIVRSGARSPKSSNKKTWMTVNWPEGPGMLTDLGKQQHYLMGNQTHSELVDKLKFLPEKYDSEAIYVQSSDYARTKLAALIHLEGMYPLGTHQVLNDSLAYDDDVPIGQYDNSEQLYSGNSNSTYRKVSTLLNESLETNTSYVKKEVENKTIQSYVILSNNRTTDFELNGFSEEVCPVMSEYKFVNFDQADKLFEETLNPLYDDLKYIYGAPDSKMNMQDIYPYMDATNCAIANQKSFNKTLPESSLKLAKDYLGMLKSLILDTYHFNILREYEDYDKYSHLLCDSSF